MAEGQRPVGEQVLAAILEHMRIGNANQEELTRRLLEDGRAGGGRDRDRDDGERHTAKELEKFVMEFRKQCPTFERGKDRWPDFASRFTSSKRLFRLNDAQAKEALWTSAIRGAATRLLIAGMRPDTAPYNTMTFDDYMAIMARKFSPASESLQMRNAYRTRVQSKDEDVQSYMDEKFEMYKLAYPEGERDLTDFFAQTTKGIYNQSVRRKVWNADYDTFADYTERAVKAVQVELQMLECGDSDSTSKDGLMPVTRTGIPQARYRRDEPMEVDSLRQMEDYPEEYEEVEEDTECEGCAYLQERGFSGPCYYCQKKGHLIRNCPRKSAGLPRIRGQVQQGTYRPNRGRGLSRGRGLVRGAAPNRGGYRGRSKLNHLEQGEYEEDQYEDEEYEQEEDGEAQPKKETHFLGVPL
jgi:hypothetical protein